MKIKWNENFQACFVLENLAIRQEVVLGFDVFFRLTRVLLKVTMHLQGCLACKRCSASDINCRYLNPYIKLKLIGLAIRLYQKF